jgi:succinate dehydrogenase / fumarate reductase cytochrome b subunit
MASLFSYLKSSILSKVVMAATGVVLVAFLFGHMLGNTQMYLGQEKMNHYAETLQGLGGALWIIRSVMFLSVLLHIITSVYLKFLNMKARPVAYEVKKWVKASIFSRTMLWTGVMIALFVTYHIMHFTLGSTNPGSFHITDAAGRHDVYTMVLLGYQNAAISCVYIAAMLMLGFHLNHAISSAFQTLGVNHPKYNRLIGTGSIVVSLVIMCGFISVPLGVLLGIIKPVATAVAGGL